MRLRQVALASRDLDGVVARLGRIFGIKVAYNDPHIHVYGLRNAVLPAGRSFLEVVEPVSEDASAARHLNRRGGDAGYMVILQVADAVADQARAEALGVRVVDVIDRPDYRCAHFHPADFGGMLVSFDQQRDEPDLLAPYGAWMPAGPDWRGARSDLVEDLACLTLTTPDPAGLAARWSALLGRSADPADPLRIPLDAGEIRFAAAPEGSPTLIGRIDLVMADPQGALERARQEGLEAEDGGVRIGGVVFRPVGRDRGED